MSDPLATRQDHSRGPRPGTPPRGVRRRPGPPARPSGPQPRQPSPMAGSPLATLQDIRRKYILPSTPEMAWEPPPEKRSRLLGLLVLLGVLVLQAVLTFRLDNGVSEDEALYLNVGRALLEGGSSADHASSLTGAPYLYPMLAAQFEQSWGLEGARLFSMLLLLAATAVAYSAARMLFGLRPAMLAAVTVAVVAPVAVSGGLATPTALSAFLLTVAVWLTAALARRGLWSVLPVALVCALTYAASYTALFFLPLVAALTVSVVVPRKGTGKAVTQGLGVLLLTGVLVGAFYVVGGASQAPSTVAEKGTGSDALAGLGLFAEQSGLYLLLVLFGMVMFWRKGELQEIPGEEQRGPWPKARLLTGAVMSVAALLPLLYLLRPHTVTEAGGHLLHGMLFAAPLAGMGMAQLLGAHFRTPQFPIAAWLAFFVLGYMQATASYSAWPNLTGSVQALKAEPTLAAEDARHLASSPRSLSYMLGTDLTSSGQWSRPQDLTDLTEVREGKFAMIILDSRVAPEVNARMREEIIEGGHYRLRAKLDYGRGSQTGDYRIWVRYP